MATKFTLNGTSYDSVEAMPPDVRQLYEQMMLKAKNPLATKNELKISFQVNGPHLTIHKSIGTSTPMPISFTTGSSPEVQVPTPMPKPIEPGAGPGGRMLLMMAAGAAAGLFLWWVMRAH